MKKTVKTPPKKPEPLVTAHDIVEIALGSRLPMTTRDKDLAKEIEEIEKKGLELWISSDGD
jgi:hypothetical protein